jgi:hypothetical protein
VFRRWTYWTARRDLGGKKPSKERNQRLAVNLSLGAGAGIVTHQALAESMD